MSGTVCKEQTSKCKCIVKEKILDGGHDKCEEKKDNKDCSEMYKQLGSCLKECLMEKSRKKKNGDDKSKSKSDFC